MCCIGFRLQNYYTSHIYANIFVSLNLFFVTKIWQFQRKSVSLQTLCNIINYMKSKVLLVLLTTLTSLSTWAQMGKLFDADKQMSSSFTNQVYMDRDGFIWAATRNGLNRYDGYQFQIFKKEKNGTNGMASNSVNCIMQDRQGLFYVGMFGAFQTYDGDHFRDIRTHDLKGNVSPCYITCLLERRNGEVLVGTSGHGLMRMKGKEDAYEVGGILKDLKTVRHMTEDRQGNIWLATESQGVICYNGKTVRKYFQDDQLRNTVTVVCEDGDGRIYAGTVNAGLFRIDGNQFTHIDATGNKSIATLYVNRAGNLMIGYDGQGLGVFYPKNGVLIDNPYYSREVELNSTKVYSIIEDLSGNVWLGLLQKGIYMEPGKGLGFGYMGYKLGERNTIGQACVTSVAYDSKENVWIGTDKDGLYCFNNEAKLLKHFKENFPASILCIEEDQQGRVWIGSYKEGGGWIDPASMTYHEQEFPQGRNVSVFDAVNDRQGHLWLATMGYGLLRYDLQTGEVKAYTMQEDAITNRQANCIVNNYISQLALSPDGRRIYAATTMGICALDIKTESWLSTFGINTPNYGIPIRVAKEYKGILYIGTNDGLYCYNLKQQQTQHIGLESGLSDNGIAAIEEDKQGRLWIATAHGLCCYDPKTGKTDSYFVDNGLQSNEFSDGASCQSKDGRFLFGGLGGITWFYPLTIRQSEWSAEVKVTGFLINGQPITPETESGWWNVIDTTVIASKRFDLSFSDNSFAVQLSTLTYDTPEHITYRYRINKEPWVRLQPGNNEITFSHMPPGTYEFCVVAERNNIATPERCFTVVIHYPWYRTWWAYLLYLAVIGLAVWQLVRFRRRKVQDQLRMQEHIHAEEMADAKLRFFMNISHEIRTPMTLIITPLLSLIKQDNDPHRRSIYETIRRNAERIMGLINQMMDLRKIDKGQMQMRMCETDLISFVRDIHTLFTQQARTKNITFNYLHDTNTLPVWIDRDNFDKVIVNILSNAFKFTKSGGEIRISISHDDQHARISVYDDGESIPEDKLSRIFERFYQLPTSSNDRNVGTGIGLDLTRSLVELHHGTIEAHNNSNGHGCEFIVTIPLGNAHLKPEEIIQDEPESPKTSLLPEEPEEMAENTDEMADLPKLNRRQKLVIVEDDYDIREFLINELKDNYDVTGCENGLEGLQQVMRVMPDLVISDVMMPEMDGNTLCSKIKSSPSTSHIPVILVTAKNRDEDQLEGLETGADAYVVKPFNMDILRRTIVNLVHTHQMLRLKYGRNDQLEQKVEEIKVKSPDEKLLERVMNVISKNINNSDLSVDRIAEEVGISRVHLHRKMKELTGQTPHDFIRNIRLKQAANLLANQNMNITEVMYACGFNNAASFSTIFKKFYGLSPRDYMKEHGQR